LPPPLPRQAIPGQKLLDRTFPPLRGAVDGLLPEGVTVLAGRPKLGKSWLALALSLAVAAGTPALGTLPVTAGPALYLALEEGERRLQGRLRLLLGERLCPGNWDYATTWPALDDGGLEALLGWLARQAGPRLVVIDTLQRVRPRETAATLYGQDYETLAPLADLAAARRVNILVVHHTRKAATEDALDAVSGTTGLTAAADAVLVLARGRGERTGQLTVMGRDVEERTLALALAPAAPLWTLAGEGAGARVTPERERILTVLAEADGPLTPKAIAAALGEDESTRVRVQLTRLLADGLVTRAPNGGYCLPGATPPALPEPTATAADPPARAAVDLVVLAEPPDWRVPETVDELDEVCFACGAPVELYGRTGLACCARHEWPPAEPVTAPGEVKQV
jgi:hypothetical protein